MPIKIKDLTPKRIKETVEVLELLKKMAPDKLETLEILLSHKQSTLLQESIQSYKAGERTFPLQSNLDDY